MSNKNIKTNNETTNNSIINVVVNGMTAVEAITEVKVRLESVEKSAFNIALLCAYGTGITIPEYTDNKGNLHGEATCTNKMKQKDFIKLVGRSKATISRWLTAMNFVIENNYFTDFSTGIYPFSYDKIIDILGTPKAFENSGTFSELMSLSASTLSEMVKAYNESKSTTKEDTTTKAGEDGEESTTSEETTSESATDTTDTANVETTVISYNGKEYTVPKEAFEKWLAENALVK